MCAVQQPRLLCAVQAAASVRGRSTGGALREHRDPGQQGRSAAAALAHPLPDP